MLDPWTIEITDSSGEKQEITGKNIILATGARPFVPPINGLADVNFLTSDTIWERLSSYDAPPRRVVVVGGGPIGCELSQALAALGVGVSLVEVSDGILAREDPDVGLLVSEQMEKDGVSILPG